MARIRIDVEGSNAEATLKRIRGQFSDLNATIEDTTESTSTFSSSFTKKLALIGGSAYALLKVKDAFVSLAKSSFDYNIQMDASKSKLTAMISASKGWETVSGRQVAFMERQNIIAGETSKTMELLKKANAETAMGMSELVDVFALMKPGMDRVNASTSDQVKILKLVTNAASNYGMSAQELSTGIDDLATGTWLANSGFGKMAKSLGITKEEVKSTNDVVGYLSEKLKDVGQAQDNWATAVSNFEVAWGEMAGEITKPIFEPSKNAIKVITEWMGVHGVKASEALGKAFASFSAVAVRVIARVVQSISGLVSAVQIAAKGIAMLGHAAKGIGAKIGETLGETASWWGDKLGISAFKDAGKTMTDFYTPALNNSLDAISKLKLGVDGIASSQGDFNNTLGSIVKGFETYNAEALKAGGSTDTLAKKVLSNSKKLNNEKVKQAKKTASKIAKIKKDEDDKLWKSLAKNHQSNLDRRAKEYSNMADDIAGDFASAFEGVLGGDIFSAFKSFFSNIGTTLAKPFVDDMSKQLSGMFSSMIGSLGSVGSAFMGVGLGILGSILGSIFGKDDFKYSNVGTTQHENGADITDILGHMDWAMTRTMKYSGGMLDNLQALVVASGQAARGLIASGHSFGEKPASLSGGFWSSKSSTMHEQGLAFGKNLGGGNWGSLTADEIKNMMASTFMSGESTKSYFGGLFSGKTKQWYSESDLNAEDPIVKSIAKAYQSGIDAVLKGNDILKMGSAEDLLKSFSGGGHKLDLQGMSQEEMAKAIEASIGSDLDKWVTSYAGWIDEFAQNSETALETYMRVAYEFEASQQMFEDLGAGLTTFGQLGVEVSQAFIKASGGIQEALTNVSGYIENFYTEDEKQQLRMEQIMRGSGILPEDAAAYRKKIEDLTFSAGAGDKNAADLLAEMLRQQQLYFDYYEKAKEELVDMEAVNDELIRIQEENMNKEMTWQQKRLAFYKDIQSKMVSAYTGTLSYLNFVEKADFMAQIAANQLEAGDTQGYFNSLGKQLEYEKKMALTKEQYALKFDSYINELQNAEPEKTTDDVVQTLQDLLAQNIRIEDAIANSSYQTPIH